MCCLSSCFSPFLPASWPLNCWWRVCLPVVCSPNWSQDADALAALERHIKHTFFLRLNQHWRWGELWEAGVGEKVKDVKIDDWDMLLSLVREFPRLLFWTQQTLQEIIRKIAHHLFRWWWGYIFFTVCPINPRLACQSQSARDLGSYLAQWWVITDIYSSVVLEREANTWILGNNGFQGKP